MRVAIYFLHKHCHVQQPPGELQDPPTTAKPGVFEKYNAQPLNSQPLKLTIKSTSIINGAVRPSVVLNRGLTFWELNDCVQ